MVCTREVPLIGPEERAIFKRLLAKTQNAIFHFGGSIYMMNHTHEQGSGLLYIMDGAPVIPLHQMGYRFVSQFLGEQVCKPYCKLWYMRGLFIQDEELDTNFFIFREDGDAVVMTNEFDKANPDNYRGGLLQELPNVVYRRRFEDPKENTVSDLVIFPWLMIEPLLRNAKTEKKRIVVIRQEDK